MFTWLKNILTSGDNVTYSMSKFVAVGAECAMVFNFLASGDKNYLGLGAGTAAIIAALAAKTYVETKNA